MSGKKRLDCKLKSRNGKEFLGLFEINEIVARDDWHIVYGRIEVAAEIEELQSAAASCRAVVAEMEDGRSGLVEIHSIVTANNGDGPANYVDVIGSSHLPFGKTPTPIGGWFE